MEEQIVDRESQEPASSATELNQKQIIDALRAAPVTIVVQDLDLRYTSLINLVPPFTPEMLLGKTEAEFFPSDEVKPLVDFKRGVINSGKGARRTFRMTLGAKVHDMEITAEPTRAGDGTINGLVCVAWDVTRERATERALSDSQAQLRSFVTEAPTSFAMFDRELRYVAASRAWMRKYGRGHSSILGLRHYDLWPTTPDEWKLIHGAAMVGEHQSKEEDRWPQPDGTDTWTRWAVFPWRDGTGQIGGIIVSIDDISERKRAEEALRESEKKFRMMADTVPDVLFMTRSDGYSEYQNDVFYRITGLPPGSGAGAGWTAAIYEEDRERIVQAWQTAMVTGEPFEERMRLNLANGETRWFISRARPMRDEAGRILRWFGCSTDIEDQVREAALRETDRRKNEFLAMLSHELRNPLAAIRSATYVLEHIDPARPEARKARAVIDRQSSHLARIIDDLLDVTRISRGKIQIDRRLIALSSVVQRTVDDARADFEARGLTLDLWLSSGEVWMNGDATRISQVLANLLSNSAKFTPAGGHVEVFLRGDATKATLRVRDDGIGIPAEALPHIFEPFMQIESTLDRSHGGLGLGLSLVKGIVEQHGGSVHAASAGPGLGSEFTITLPVAPAPSKDAPKEERTPTKPTRVLLIEDSPDTAESLRQVLLLMGHDVHVAFDGPAGIELGRALRPELVLCDIGLPGMSGHEVAKVMRSDEAFAGATLVALSGYGQPEDRRRTAESGFTRHIVKPVQIAELEKLLVDDAG